MFQQQKIKCCSQTEKSQIRKDWKSLFQSVHQSTTDDKYRLPFRNLLFPALYIGKNLRRSAFFFCLLSQCILTSVSVKHDPFILIFQQRILLTAWTELGLYVKKGCQVKSRRRRQTVHPDEMAHNQPSFQDLLFAEVYIFVIKFARIKFFPNKNHTKWSG